MRLPQNINLATNPAARGARGAGSALAAAQGEAVVRSSSPYFSRFIFFDNKSGGNAYTFPACDLRAFGYGLGDQMAPAISPVTTGTQLALAALESDTNLASAGTPNNAEEFVIQGISILWNPNSDAEVVRQLTPEIAVSLRFGTSLEIPCGTAQMCPGSGGLFGSARQDITAAAASVGFMSNGYPDALNFRPFGEGIRWRKQGNVDSNLTALVRLRRPVTVTGVVASPASIRADGLVILHGYSERKRSVNA